VKTADERFWERVDMTGPLPLIRGAAGECWLWTGGADSYGYGRFWDGSKQVISHRWAYQRMNGPIPHGLVLDHLCRVHRCVRPDHLEPVTQGENVRRGLTGQKNAQKTACPRGHAYTEQNTRRRNGRRECRACIKRRGQQRWAA
jgi:hypothetical protein